MWCLRLNHLSNMGCCHCQRMTVNNNPVFQKYFRNQSISNNKWVEGRYSVNTPSIKVPKSRCCLITSLVVRVNDGSCQANAAAASFLQRLILSSNQTTKNYPTECFHVKKSWMSEMCWECFQSEGNLNSSGREDPIVIGREELRHLIENTLFWYFISLFLSIRATYWLLGR